MDIYSIAVTINELITREPPFGADGGFDQVRLSVLTGGRPRAMESCPFSTVTELDVILFEKLSRAVKSGWNQEWTLRPSADVMLMEFN
jgi:serine/threonine protein kinase